MEEDMGTPNTGTSAITLIVNHVSADENPIRDALLAGNGPHRDGRAEADE